MYVSEGWSRALDRLTRANDVTLCYEQYAVGHGRRDRGRRWRLYSRGLDGLFAILGREGLVGFLLVVAQKVECIFNAQKSPMDWCVPGSAFYVDSLFGV